MNEITIMNRWDFSYEVNMGRGSRFKVEWNDGSIEEYESGDYIEGDMYENRVTARIFADNNDEISSLVNYRGDLSWPGGKTLIDTSKCPSLKKLFCECLEFLDLSNNPNLERLDLPLGRFTEINLSGAKELEFLRLTHCDYIEKLDLSNCNRINFLWLYDCPALREIKLSEHSRLDKLYYNRIKSLSKESEEQLLDVLESNGGYIRKIFPGDGL